VTPKNPRFFDSHLIAFIFLSLALCAPTALAGWSEDIRLTYRGYEIHPQVIARNDTVHVAWQQVAGPHFVSYMRSTDGGVNWDSLTNLTDYGHRGSNFDLSLSGSNILVGWSDANVNPPNPLGNIAYTVSSDGVIWSRPRYVYPDTMHDHPANDLGIILNHDSIYVVYRPIGDDSTGYTPVIFRYSSDMGQSWSREITVGHTWYYTNPLLIAKCANSLYIVWSGDCPPANFNREVNGVVSIDGGSTWTEPFLVSSSDSYVAQHSCVACDEGTGYFAVGWMDYALSGGGYPGDVFVRLTSDGGQSWGEIRYATTHHRASDPSIAMIGDSIFAAWCDHDPDYGSINYEICFSRSTDLGLSWTPYERLTFAEGNSNTPWISYDQGKLHMVWWEYHRPPHSGNEIYYKRYDPEPDAIDGELDVILAMRVNLFAFPNPFNSATVINFSNLKGGEIKIFDVRGQLIRTFFTGGENEGRIIWDARDATGKTVSSGIYFARARFGSKATRAPHESQAIKLIYLK